MPFFILIMAMQVLMIVDVVRRGRPTVWIMALMFLPVAGGIAYFIVEILPGLRHNRHVRAAHATVIDKLDPERELRAAREALGVADTVANRTRVADALSDLGRHQEALPMYQALAGPAPDARTGAKLSRALHFNDRSQEALDLLDRLPSAAGQSERDDASFLRALVLEKLGRDDEALAIYRDITQRMAGDEARCHYAALLIKTGKRGQAILVLEEVEHRLKRLDRQRRAANAPMYDWAIRELASLRG